MIHAHMYLYIKPGEKNKRENVWKYAAHMKNIL